MSLYAFDLPGHGKSYGKRGHIKKFDEYLDCLEDVLMDVRKDHLDIPVKLFGHSLGGLISLSFLIDRESKEIDSAIKMYAVKEHLDFGKIYAYEIDGFGNNLFMDDANVPSLMSLGYLDPTFLNDEIYLNTRKFLLSENNPYFLKGQAAEGQASPHTGKDKIWPMGIILRAMTSDNDSEI